MWDGHLEQITVATRQIILNRLDAHTTAQYTLLRTTLVSSKNIERENIDNMQEAGMARPAVVAWTYPFVLVDKTDGSLRFCVCYRQLHAITVRGNYFISCMDKYID